MGASKHSWRWGYLSAAKDARRFLMGFRPWKSSFVNFTDF